MPLFPLIAAAVVTVCACVCPHWAVLQGHPVVQCPQLGVNTVNILLVPLVWTPPPLTSQTRCCKYFLPPLRKKPAAVTCYRNQAVRLRDHWSAAWQWQRIN